MVEPQLEEIVGKAVMEAETVASFGSLSKSGRGDDIQTIKFCHIQVTTVYTHRSIYHGKCYSFCLSLSQNLISRLDFNKLEFFGIF